MFKRIIAFVFIVSFQHAAFAQQKFLPLERGSNRLIEAEMTGRSKILHSSVRPYLESEIDSVMDPDSLRRNWFGRDDSTRRSWAHRKLFSEHLLQYRDQGVSLSADLLFDFSLGHESGRSMLFNNTRAVQLQGDLGKDFSFYTSFYENLSRLPSWVDSYTGERGVVPGQGKARYIGSKVDYAVPYGYISYTPNSFFNFQLGQGKNFFGDGYRSLILSDFAYNYPFIKISTRFWKLKYVNLWTQYRDISAGFTQATYPKKYASYQYLSYALNPRLNISLFQSLIWAPDPDAGVQLEYLNPLIFMNALNFNMGSPANSLMGLNMRYNFLKKYSAYGQFVLDDFNLKAMGGGKGFFQQKYGFQLGLKAFDALGLKNLFLQAELNRVRPYVYGHRTLKISNTHFNEALAHPLGANFTEGLLNGSYKHKRLVMDLRLLYARYGADANGSHFGKDIFRADFEAPNGQNSFGNYTGQGVPTSLYFANPSLSYLINPATNMQVELGFIFRKEHSSLLNERSRLVYLGIKTALTNRYSDF